MDGILSLKDNYKPQNNHYTLKEINSFVEIVAYQQLTMKYTDWCKNLSNKKIAVEINRFPSLQILCYLVFYKFYINNRRPRLSDIPDLLMATAYPHVDEVITEKNQCEIVRQIQKKHKICEGLKLYTINDFF